MAHILVADDYAVTRRVLGYQIQKLGHSVAMAVDGGEAIEMLRGAGPPADLLILDLSMPEMDGLSVLRALRADPRFAALPVVILTASGQDADLLAARSAGASLCLTKPASSWDISEALSRLLPGG